METGDPGDPGDPAQTRRDAPDGLLVTTLDSATSGESHTNRAWRWGLRLGGGIALLGLIAVAAVALIPLIPRPPAPKPKPLDITALQVPAAARSCIVASAWSPDSAQVAILRDSLCVPNGAQPGPSVLIFNGVTGSLVNAFPFNAPSFDATIPPGSTGQTSDRVDLVNVSWSPDGFQVAIPFIIGPLNAPSPVTLGLALLTVRGPDVGALRISTLTSSTFTPSDPLMQSGPHTIIEWDTQAAQRTLTLTPSYAYQWSVNGALEPIAPPSAQGAPSSPAGGASASGVFSMWRSGHIWSVNALACAVGGEKPLPHPYIALNLTTLAWSPDGRYIAGVNVSGRYDPPATPANATPTPRDPGTDCTAGPPPDPLPLAPVHDAGLRSALALVGATGSASMDLAWRPDGRRLAAVTFNTAGSENAILLYDCRTGAVLKRYTAGQFPINGPPGTGPAKNFNEVFTGGAWAPNGQRLLIEATGTGAVPFIMGPSALGA